MSRVPYGLKDLKKFHPAYAKVIPGFRLDRSGGVVNSNLFSDTCPHCNSNRILPMRMPGFTLYECLTCREKWRDSYDRPGMTLTPKQWKARKRKVGNEFGRILV